MPAGSSRVAVRVNTDSGLVPPAPSHTQAATTPPGRVTRAISRTPRTWSDMKCTTSWASAASKVSSANGSASADASRTSARGNRSAVAATNEVAGSTAVMRASSVRRASSAVSIPGPQPTSITVGSGSTPARATSANTGANGVENRPMNRS